MKKQTTGKLLRTLREKAGYSQLQLARRAGLGVAQNVSNIERDVAPLPARRIKRMAKLLNVHPQVLARTALEDHARDFLRKAGVR